MLCFVLVVAFCLPIKETEDLQLQGICQPQPSILSWVTQCNLAHDQATSGQVAGALFIFATRISFGFKLQKSISDSILIHILRVLIDCLHHGG
jgi:hypothetical protein